MGVTAALGLASPPVAIRDEAGTTGGTINPGVNSDHRSQGYDGS
jgi:hypothetical protein